MTPDLIARLEALGGMLTGEISKQGTYEVLTPRCCPYKYIWSCPEGLAGLISEWEAQPRLLPRMARTFYEWEHYERSV